MPPAHDPLKNKVGRKASVWASLLSSPKEKHLTQHPLEENQPDSKVLVQ